VTLAGEALTLAVPGRVLCRCAAFAVEPGQVWAVLGANGSGKTTLLHALAGIARAAGGAVRLDGAPLAALDARARARRVGLLLQQEEGVFWGSVAEYAMLGAYPRLRLWSGAGAAEREQAAAALRATGLEALAERRYTTLSGGERQRARIAQLLVQDPDYLLLDEPLQHLDLKHQAAVLRLARALARERGKGVVMVLHDASWPARACSHALLLYDGGAVEAGPVPALLARDRLERLYGCRLRGADGPEQVLVPDV
jgi:iron complex transport system ATP-binding protein